MSHFARLKRMQRWISLSQQSQQCDSRSDCIQIAKHLAEGKAWITFLYPIRCVAREPRAHRRICLLHTAGLAQTCQQMTDLSRLLSDDWRNDRGLRDFHVRKIDLKDDIALFYEHFIATNQGAQENGRKIEH